ncbi:hypothetical protein ABN16_07890 [Levilactobacillus koreensis]|uniref:Uncharacterized protein n=1 Tax=Levilactobacillus koreensis TaxID=637971 RepID=A0AAC8UWF3_9LACO|nr:hypothetical protein ABN16_07890 [Levilactobacillus koreensis]
MQPAGESLAVGVRVSHRFGQRSLPNKMGVNRSARMGNSFNGGAYMVRFKALRARRASQSV